MIVGGLQAGMSANVQVTGSAGFSQTVTSGQIIENLTTGAYTVTSNPTRKSGAVVDLWFDATGGGVVNVVSGQKASTNLTYSPRDGSSGLWIAGWGETVVQLLQSQLGASATVNPSVKIDTEASSNPSSATFDSKGNLWITYERTDKLVRFDIAQLAANGSTIPAITITATGGELDGVVGAAFDAAGNLWVGSRNAKKVVMFTPAQLSAGGAQTPTIILSDNANSLNGANFPTFDISGNMWISNTTQDSVVMFTPAQITASGSPAPTVTLTGTEIDWPCQMAFNKAGNLWVTSYYRSRVLKYAPAQIVSSGSPAPSVILSGANLGGAAGIAFDSSNHLWVAAFDADKLVKFTPDQITVSGSPAPAIVLGGPATDSAFGLAFSATPSGYPIKP